MVPKCQCLCVSDESLPSITQFPNSVTVQNYINLSKLKEREKSRKINLMVLPARQLGRVTLKVLKVTILSICCSQPIQLCHQG